MYKNNNKIFTLYLNGLNGGKISYLEKLAMRHLAKNGIIIKHLPINWYTKDSFEDILDSIIKATELELKQHNSLVIIGASAGGSMAINTYAKLQNKNVKVVTLCSRINETSLAWWDLRTLKRMAHIGTKRESTLFYDSINYCSLNVLPILTDIDIQNIICVKQLLDETVPKRTMKYAGMHIYSVPIIGHHLGIVLGLLNLRKILT